MNKLLVLGYEFSAVTESGEQVTLDLTTPCGKRGLCEHGDCNMRENMVIAVHGKQDGAMHEWLA